MEEFKMTKFKKIFFSIFFIFTICFSILTTYAYSSLSNYKPKYGTLTENVNFRTTASTSSGKIRTLSKGTKVKMVGTIDSFYIVQLGSNEVGVVSKSYVKSASSAPSGATQAKKMALQFLVQYLEADLEQALEKSQLLVLKQRLR